MARAGTGIDGDSLASAKYRNLLAAIPDLIIYLSPAGVAEHFHASAVNALPMPPERFVGKPIEEFLPVEAAEEARLAMEVAREGGGVQVLTHDMLGPDGSTRHIEARIAWTTLGEFVVIVRDVTERQRQEDLLRRSERLASIGSLLSKVAHELSNPLSAIQNFTELLLMEPRSPDDQEAMEIIRRESYRAAKLVSELRMMTPQS